MRMVTRPYLSGGSVVLKRRANKPFNFSDEIISLVDMMLVLLSKMIG